MLFAAALLPFPASAGHLFTQASSNTPINLTAGTGIQITQLTFEGTGTNGNVSLNFGGDWNSGDAVKITIGSYIQTFTYDSPLSGTTQTASALVVNDPTLTAAGILKSPSTQWTVIATSGTFTFQGYRIYVVDGTFNGTGADTITQSQVVSENQLNGGSSTPASFVPAATSSNLGLAQQLDALNGSATGELGAVITTMSAMTAESQQLALKLISPETSQAVAQSSVNTAVAALDTVQLRLDSLRTGIGVNNSFAHRETSTDASHEGHDEKSADSEGMSSGDDALRRNLWLKGFGGKAGQDAKDGFAGSNDRIYGTMLGYDTTVTGGWLVGGAFGYAKTNVNMTDYRSGDGADINTYQLTGYFGRAYEKWYLNGMLTYATQNYATTRDTHLTGVAQGSFKGDLYGLRLLAGAPISLANDYTVTPYGGMEVNRVKQHSYTESGAGALSLNVAANSVDRVRSIIGTEVATLKKLDNGGALRPSVKLNWRHEFKDEGVNTTTSLVGGGSQFETIGQSINRNVYGLIGRLNWERSEQSNISIELGVESGSGYSSVFGQIMGGWRF